ncbi:hypothetical protein UFOVP369_51 [uncultured Caudovirales phage]|uniref:Uncharacterized protein n=1 Tax=uncultured Caudovirales phage TaxID=2100421 RepID=A0A6J7WZ30_9CAUD|nr:hypothetical protein UFOVP369_51 [uncultured Caudovirales phage]
MSFVTDALGITGQDEPDYSQMEFKPYSISGPTGGVSFEGKTGTVNLSPELKALYEKYTNAATAALPSEEQMQFAKDVSGYGKGLFGEATGMDTGAMTADYYNKVQNILNPARLAENSALANTLFSQGRTGVGAGVEGGYVNPEQFALLKAREGQNQQIFLGSEDRARQIQMDKLKQGLGYYGMGQELQYQPYQTSAGLLGTGINLANINNPYIGYGLQAGTAGAQAGANIVGAQQQYADTQMGFWGDLIGGASTVFGGAKKPWFLG